MFKQISPPKAIHYRGENNMLTVINWYLFAFDSIKTCNINIVTLVLFGDPTKISDPTIIRV